MRSETANWSNCHRFRLQMETESSGMAENEWGSSPDRRGWMTSPKVRTILTLLNDPRRRERMLRAMNWEDMDDAGPVGGERGMKVLQEMNELGWDEERP